MSVALAHIRTHANAQYVQAKDARLSAECLPGKMSNTTHVGNKRAWANTYVNITAAGAVDREFYI